MSRLCPSVAKLLLVFPQILALAGASQVADGRTMYWAEPLSATIVDATSGVPLRDVNVVAGWEAKGGLEGGNVVGWVKVMETVTDANGNFAFPGWGPKPNPTSGGVGPGSPLLLLFKPGYKFTYLYDRSRTGPNGRRDNFRYRTEAGDNVIGMRSYWDRKTISLQQIDGTSYSMEGEFGSLTTRLDTLLANDQCNWRFIPRFLWAIHIHSQSYAQREGSRIYVSLTELDALSRKCGSLREYVEAHGK